MTVDALDRTEDASATNRLHLAIGMMSGTSLDGVDAALIRSDGQGQVERLGGVSLAYEPAFRDQLRGILGRTDRDAADVREVAEALTRRHLEAVQQLLAQQGLTSEDVHVLGFHGQTIHHEPELGVTVQIGDGQLLADLTGCRVVADFRQADVAAGGQGAPLAPLYHQALTGNAPRPLAVANIGGVGNITFIGEAADHVIAFDTGPGNALIDDLIQQRTGKPYDADGALAAAGSIDQPALTALLDNPYFTAPHPKSLDRDAFDAGPVSHLSLADSVATLTAFTAQSIMLGVNALPAKPQQLLVTGGGRHNGTMMQMLQNLAPCPVHPMEHVGANGDLLEAECFAWLALRCLDGLPLSVPGTTGVPTPQTGGRVFEPRS